MWRNSAMKAETKHHRIEAKQKHEQQLARLQSEIDAGLIQIRRGEVLDGRTVFDRLLEKNRWRSRIH
jgi:hypothetical protein